MPERDPVVRRQIWANSDHLVWTEIFELPEQFGDVDAELQVDVQHDEFVVGKNSEKIFL